MSNTIRAFLIDLDGTVYQDGRLIPGVAEALEAVGRAGVAFLFATNTTSRPRAALSRMLGGMGLSIPPERILTAAWAARDHLVAAGLTRCHFLVTPALMEDLSGIEAVDSAARAVVVGDIGEGFTFQRLDHAFRLLLEGAELVALARNRYFRSGGRLVLDAGPFVAALEYASGHEAILLGKPSPAFYRRALAALGVAPEDAVVVGDDLESDVGGGQAVGMRGILVRTGKFRPGLAEGSPVRPDAVLDSLAELPRLL